MYLTENILIVDVCSSDEGIFVHYKVPSIADETISWKAPNSTAAPKIDKNLVLLWFLLDCLPRWAEVIPRRLSVRCATSIPNGLVDIFEFILSYNGSLKQRIHIEPSNTKYFVTAEVIDNSCSLSHDILDDEFLDGVSKVVNTAIASELVGNIVLADGLDIQEVFVNYPKFLIWTARDMESHYVNAWTCSTVFLASFQRALKSVFGKDFILRNQLLEEKSDNALALIDQVNYDCLHLSDNAHEFRNLMKIWFLMNSGSQDLSRDFSQSTLVSTVFKLRYMARASEAVRRSMAVTFPKGSEYITHLMVRRLERDPSITDFAVTEAEEFWTQRGYATLGVMNPYSHVWGRVSDEA